MTELQQYIKSYFGVSSNDLKIIQELFFEEDLNKGDFYVKKGHYCNKFSFVKNGYFRVFAPQNNKDVTQWISSNGYFITDLSSLVFDTPARWNIQALTDCKLYTISKNDYNLLNQKVENWQHLEKLFISKCFLTLEDRVFNLISLSAEERYDKLFEQDKELFNIIPLQYLASMLGMSPETLSRIRKKKLS